MSKYYKTTITFEVLSEEELGEMEMQDIVNECIDGGFSGMTTNTVVEVLNKEQIRAALEAQGSDPDFFSPHGDEDE